MVGTFLRIDRIRRQYLPLLYHPEDTPAWTYFLVVVVERAAMPCERATLGRAQTQTGDQCNGQRKVAIVDVYVLSSQI